MLGVELVVVPGREAPRPHKVGLQVDNFLREAREEAQRLRGANKTRKSKAHSKLESDALRSKLEASDLKFQTDRRSCTSAVEPYPAVRARR